MIQLDEKHRINVEERKLCILEFFETRTKNEGKENEEEFEYVDQYFYPDVKSCLVKYLDLCQEQATSIEEILQKTKEVENLINSLQISNNSFKTN